MLARQADPFGRFAGFAGADCRADLFIEPFVRYVVAGAVFIDVEELLVGFVPAVLVGVFKHQIVLAGELEGGGVVDAGAVRILFARLCRQDVDEFRRAGWAAQKAAAGDLAAFAVVHDWGDVLRRHGEFGFAVVGSPAAQGKVVAHVRRGAAWLCGGQRHQAEDYGLHQRSSPDDLASSRSLLP